MFLHYPPPSGGDFQFGDASEDALFPEQLMESGRVVVVTPNYRLGPMGFLSLPGCKEVRGNQVGQNEKKTTFFEKGNPAYCRR